SVRRHFQDSIGRSGDVLRDGTGRWCGKRPGPRTIESHVRADGDAAMSVAALEWSAANQRCLVQALDAVRARLEGSDSMPVAPAWNPPPDEGFMSALDRLCDAFGLSPFER